MNRFVEARIDQDRFRPVQRSIDTRKQTERVLDRPSDLIKNQIIPLTQPDCGVRFKCERDATPTENCNANGQRLCHAG